MSTRGQLASAYVCCPRYETGALSHYHRDLCRVVALSCNDGQQDTLVELGVVQVCGEAVYVDDMKMHNMLHAALVYSSRPHAKLLSVDASAAIRASDRLHHCMLTEPAVCTSQA